MCRKCHSSQQKPVFVNKMIFTFMVSKQHRCTEGLFLWQHSTWSVWPSAYDLWNKTNYLASLPTLRVLPSPSVCFRRSCLACSFTMRLLPFKYSLYFWGKKWIKRFSFSFDDKEKYCYVLDAAVPWCYHLSTNSQWSRNPQSPADWLVSYWCWPCSCRSQRKLIWPTLWIGCAGKPLTHQSLPQWACPGGSAWLHQVSSSPSTHIENKSYIKIPLHNS